MLTKGSSNLRMKTIAAGLPTNSDQFQIPTGESLLEIPKRHFCGSKNTSLTDRYRKKI